MSYSDLPLTSQIFNEDIIRKSLLEEQKQPDEEPDRRLENWNKWLENRQEMSRRLATKLKRHHCELLFNYGESLNSVKNDKLVLEYTKIPYPHDKYRGNPSFFEAPVALKRKHPCDPDYFAIKTKQDSHLIPEVEYVTVPKCIRKEKKLICSGFRNITNVWLDSAYRKKRVQELQEQLKIVEPYKPQMEELCMIGKSVRPDPEWSISIFKHPSHVDDFQVVYTPRPILKGERTDVKQAPRARRHSKHEGEEYVLINYYKLCAHVLKGKHNIYLDFEYDISSGSPTSNDLIITNCTSVLIKYYFKEALKYELFHDIIKSDHTQVFFYDKRLNIVLPNETKISKIYFKTNTSSYYTLTLQLLLIPNMFSPKIFIKLSAVSSKKNLPEKIEILKEYIENKITKSTARDVIRDILDNIPRDHSHITLYTYDRGYIFESVNQKFSPTIRRPKYIYDREVVDELERFYAKVKFKGCHPYWNYDIEELKKITRKREKLNRQKDTLDRIYLMKLQDMHRRMLLGEDIDKEIEDIKRKMKKTSDETELLFSGRIETLINDLKGVIDNKKEETESLTTQLENILLKLDTTFYCINNMYDNYGYVYAILCITFDKIIFDVEKIKDIFQIKTIDRYPTNLNIPPFEAIQNEVFMDEEHPKYPKLKQDFTQEGQPPCELLKGIPHDDTNARHIAYFGVQEQEEPKGKKKGKKKGDKKAKGKKGKKDKTSKEAKSQKAERPPTPQADLKPVPNFEDPFKQQTDSYISVAQTLSLLSENKTSESLSAGSIEYQIEEYKLNLYNIFYKHLSQAVMRIVDVIETSKPRKLKLAEFKSIWTQKKGKGQSVKVRYIDVKKALCRVIGVKSKKKIKGKRQKHKKKEKIYKLAEPLKPKEQGSQWSILRPLKQPQPSQKPISYPELCLLVRKKNINKESVDVATIMSVCSGFDANWQDFKDVSVQVESESYHPPVWESKGVASGVVGEIVGEVCDKVFTEDEVEDMGIAEEISGEEEESDVFFDEDFSDPELNLGAGDLYNLNT